MWKRIKFSLYVSWAEKKLTGKHIWKDFVSYKTFKVQPIERERAQVHLAEKHIIWWSASRGL